jgi:CBS domain-containing protein
MLTPHLSLSASPPATMLSGKSTLSALTRVSPALAVMTDFSYERPVSVLPERHIDDALHDMILAGIRALLVVDATAVLGLITASDILGTRPIQFLQSPLCDGQPCRHRDVHVADVMTPWTELRLIDFASLATATAGDLADQFSGIDATHLLVIERSVSGGNVVRGLVSRTRLERQLSITIPVLS